ncbi:hypothetical protein LguiA_034929 [Lonicera macranthoides]
MGTIATLTKGMFLFSNLGLNDEMAIDLSISLSLEALFFLKWCLWNPVSHSAVRNGRCNEIETKERLKKENKRIGGGPYGSEVTRGQDLTGKDFSGKTLIKQDFKTRTYPSVKTKVYRKGTEKGAGIEDL